MMWILVFIGGCILGVILTFFAAFITYYIQKWYDLTDDAANKILFSIGLIIDIIAFLIGYYYGMSYLV